MNHQQVKSDVDKIIGMLVDVGLSDHQIFPNVRSFSKNVVEVSIPGSPDLSAAMRAQSYEEIYKTLVATGSYHVKMIDGALVQFLYRFQNGSLISHRLAIFPNPGLADYDEAVELYEEDELFGNIFDYYTVKSPLRFDYNMSDELFKELDHPKSHFTIGQIKFCRIPINGPVSPFRFMRFILRNFYFSAYHKINIDNDALVWGFDDTITEKERKILHIVS